MEGDLMLASWIWGVLLIVLTIAIHAVGIVAMTPVMMWFRVGVEKRNRGLRYAIPTVVGVLGVIGLLLAVLSGIEATIWAVAYFWLGALGSLAEGMLYSVDALTTRGASGLMLLPHWRMLGALEATDGMLLFGISTAFMFAVMQVYWPMLYRRL